MGNDHRLRRLHLFLVAAVGVAAGTWCGVLALYKIDPPPFLIVLGTASVTQLGAVGVSLWRHRKDPTPRRVAKNPPAS